MPEENVAVAVLSAIRVMRLALDLIESSKDMTPDEIRDKWAAMRTELDDANRAWEAAGN